MKKHLWCLFGSNAELFYTANGPAYGKIVLSSLFVALIVVPVITKAQNAGCDVNMPNDLGKVVFNHDEHTAKGLTYEQCHPEHYTMVKKIRVLTR